MFAPAFCFHYDSLCKCCTLSLASVLSDDEHASWVVRWFSNTTVAAIAQSLRILSMARHIVGWALCILMHLFHIISTYNTLFILWAFAHGAFVLQCICQGGDAFVRCGFSPPTVALLPASACEDD